MKCLRCKTVDLELQFRGEGSDIVEIDICAKCGGIWLDSKELGKIDDNFFLDLEDIDYDRVNPTKEDAALQCPRCEKSPIMNKVHPKVNANVIIDTCPECHGFWLDKGELDKMKDVSDKVLIASLLSLDD